MPWALPSLSRLGLAGGGGGLPYLLPSLRAPHPPMWQRLPRMVVARRFRAALPRLPLLPRLHVQGGHLDPAGDTAACCAQRAAGTLPRPLPLWRPAQGGHWLSSCWRGRRIWQKEPRRSHKVMQHGKSGRTLLNLLPHCGKKGKTLPGTRPTILDQGPDPPKKGRQNQESEQKLRRLYQGLDPPKKKEAAKPGGRTKASKTLPATRPTTTLPATRPTKLDQGPDPQQKEAAKPGGRHKKPKGVGKESQSIETRNVSSDPTQPLVPLRINKRQNSTRDLAHKTRPGTQTQQS